MMSNTRAEFPFEVFTKYFAQSCFQKPGLLLCPTSSLDYWTHEFPVKLFLENFSLTSYYKDDAMGL